MTLPEFKDLPIHLTGVKGTGMAALAEVLHAEGAVLSGSDVADRFFTDSLLEAIGLVPFVGFAAEHIPEQTGILVYSAAYGPENPERAEAQRRGLPQYSYTEMLGALSQNRRSLAVSGVHGKTTTTAMIGSLVDAIALPATVVVGSAVPAFGGSATLRRGTDYLVAETCEYRRNFLDYSPDVLLVTSVEADHLDYYRDEADVRDAFVAFADRLPPGGALVYCIDDPGARAVAERAREARPDLQLVPYGFTCDGPGHVGEPIVEEGRQRFTLQSPGGTDWFELTIPGPHMVLDAAAAILALGLLAAEATEMPPSTIREALSHFSGTRRRSELVAEIGGIRIMDDYAHHPTAIRTTLAGYKQFWRNRRIIVDFMSHTFSRTEGLLEEFVTAFADADIVVLNDIYASARERTGAGITGAEFAARVAEHHPAVEFVPGFPEAAERIASLLRPGDIVVTMGAGDNFRVGTMVLKLIAPKEGQR